jgi:hypothetical protein
MWFLLRDADSRNVAPPQRELVPVLELEYVDFVLNDRVRVSSFPMIEKPKTVLVGSTSSNNNTETIISIVNGVQERSVVKIEDGVDDFLFMLFLGFVNIMVK